MRYLLLTFLTCLLAVHMRVQASDAAAVAAAPIQTQEQLKTSTTDESADTQASEDDEKPCEWINERQLEFCLSEKFQRAESELNRTYKEIMASLDKGQQATLRKEERGWIKWREAECARQAKAVEDCTSEDGCGVPGTMHVECMTEEAKSRVQKMKSQWHR